MNREIKFRAWDIQYKQMANVTMMLFNSGELCHVGNYGEPKSFEHFHIMQYTGLIDKNGKEIYEGDILRWTSCNPFSFGEVRTVHVFYIEAHFWAGSKNIGIYLGELLSYERCEVIGNIYENPDLPTP